MKNKLAKISTLVMLMTCCSNSNATGFKILPSDEVSILSISEYRTTNLDVEFYIYQNRFPERQQNTEEERSSPQNVRCVRINPQSNEGETRILTQEIVKAVFSAENAHPSQLCEISIIGNRPVVIDPNAFNSVNRAFSINFINLQSPPTENLTGRKVEPSQVLEEESIDFPIIKVGPKTNQIGQMLRSQRKAG